MAFTTLEGVRIALEVAEAIRGSCPTVRQVFTDHTSTYADNQTDFAAITAAVTAVLFDTAPPTILP